MFLSKQKSFCVVRYNFLCDSFSLFLGFCGHTKRGSCGSHKVEANGSNGVLFLNHFAIAGCGREIFTKTAWTTTFIAELYTIPTYNMIPYVLHA